MGESEKADEHAASEPDPKAGGEAQQLSTRLPTRIKPRAKTQDQTSSIRASSRSPNGRSLVGATPTARAMGSCPLAGWVHYAPGAVLG